MSPSWTQQAGDNTRRRLQTAAEAKDKVDEPPAGHEINNIKQTEQSQSLIQVVSSSEIADEASSAFT